MIIIFIYLQRTMPSQYKSPEGTKVYLKGRKSQNSQKTEFQNEMKIKDTSIWKTSPKYETDKNTLSCYKFNEQKLNKFETKERQYKNLQIFDIHEEQLLVKYLLVII